MNIKRTVINMLNSMPFSYIQMYHHVTDSPLIDCSSCKLSTQSFIRHFEQDRDYVPISQVVNLWNKHCVAITFDDGLLDTYDIAYPILKAKGIPFTIFIVNSFIDKPGYISKSQLIELANDHLVTIGAHGMTHSILRGMTLADQQKEILDSGKRLEQLIGKKVDYFAYSHGAYDTNTLTVAQEYRYAFSAGGGNLNFLRMLNKYALPRIGQDEVIK